MNNEQIYMHLNSRKIAQIVFLLDIHISVVSTHFLNICIYTKEYNTVKNSFFPRTINQTLHWQAQWKDSELS